MKNLNELDKFRDRAAEADIYGVSGGKTEGVFTIEYKPGDRSGRYWRSLNVIASSGEGWDHVSVSSSHGPPTWDQMEVIKRLFFKDDETALQFHVPIAKHINIHNNCLHLWRPHRFRIKLPPEYMV